jgi:hypothetical protein
LSLPTKEAPIGSALPLEDLRRLSDDELIRRHDQQAMNTVVGIDYYLNELARRDTARQTATIRRLTWTIFAFTVVIAVVTVWAIFET